MLSRSKLSLEMKRKHMKNVCPLTVAAIAAAVTFATTTVRAQSGFYRPLTLAQAQESAATEEGAASANTPPQQEVPEGLLAGASVPAETSDGASADEIARELANPNNSLASLTLKNQLRWYNGDLPGADDQFNYTLLFQPVFPFTLPETSSGGKANVFVRPAFPILIDQPVFDAANAQFKSASGLGDIGFDIGYGVTEKSGFLWAVGMVGTLPTATDSAFGGKQLRLGPEGLLARFEKWGLYGVFPSHQWNVAGWSDQYYANTQIQAVFKVLPGGGWSIGSSPIMNYDWALKEWSIPINLTVGRTVKLGKTPVKLEIEVNYYVEQYNAFGAQWMVGFNITPVVRNVINDWVH